MAASDINSSGSSDPVAQQPLPVMPSTIGSSAPSGASTTSGNSNSLLGDIGSLGSDLGGLFTGSSSLSSIGSDLSNLASNPTAEAGALVGAGEYEAGQAQNQTAALTSQLTTPSQPFVAGGNTELSQTLSGLTGSGTAPPAGSSVAQQEQAAQELGNVATQYGTGQLTQAQNSQVQQYIQSQQQSIRQQLASNGVTDSSVLSMYDQQIQDNAAQLTQSLVSQNLGISQQALSSVQSTYNTLLNQSISQFTAGMGPIEDAVNLTVQQNTQISGELNSLFGQIARGLSGASGSSGTSGTSGTASSGNTLGNTVNTASNLVNDLSGSSLSSLGASAAAGTASELGSAAASGIGADTAGALAPAIGASPTAAELGTTADALSPFSTAAADAGAAGGAAAAGLPAGMSAAVGAAPTAAELGTTAGAIDAGGASAGAGGASSGLLSSLGALAPIGAILAEALIAPTVTGVSQSNINDAAQLGSATNAGLLSPTDTTAGSVSPFLPNGQINQQLMDAVNAMQELQGEGGVGQEQAIQLLNSLGYYSYAQQAAANGGFVPTPGGGSSPSAPSQKY